MLIERTLVGLERAWAEGKKSGSPAALDDDQHAAVRSAIASGTIIAQLARNYGTSQQTILRARAEAAA